jgi:hypothetical protein
MIKRFLTFLLDAVTMRERLRELDVKLNIALANDIANNLAERFDDDTQGLDQFTKVLNAMMELGVYDQVLAYSRARRKHLEDCGVKEREVSTFPSSLSQ